MQAYSSPCVVRADMVKHLVGEADVPFAPCSMQIWSSGNPSSADTIMAEDVRTVDLLFAQDTNGREEFKKMIHTVFEVHQDH